MTAPALVPRPTHLTTAPGALELTEATAVAAPAGVLALLRELLTPATGLPFPEAAGAGPGVLSFALSTEPADLAELGDEGYRLSVADGGLRAVATTETGLLWAVQTLRQLLAPEAYAPTRVAGTAWVLPNVEITDVPRFPWRGALLDVARWCHPIEFVHAFVDQLAMHKLNTLHLHLTDDQGWRFEVKKHPRLTEVGAWRTESNAGHAFEGRFDGVPHGGYYTQEQLKDLVAYAARRGVRIMPEIDLPGHMQAAISAYPWLGNDPERQLEVRTAWGISKHVLNVADETLVFLREILDEVVEVFPFEYVHLGGDEVPLDEWSASPDALRRVREAGLAGPQELLGWWIKQMGEHLAGHGRRIAVWDELVEAAPPKDALVFAWRGAERVQVALDAGHSVVAVPFEYVYLDYAQTDRPDEPLAIGGPLPLERVYGFEPVPDGAQGRVLGTQGMLWSEYTPTPEAVQWRAHPRLSAIAEVAWSPAAGRDPAEFGERLAVQVRRFDQAGIRHHDLGSAADDLS
ncbi:MAG: beta-N-acetylhexosaminidase [Hamadaea sp.]|nr:beta-N-acetylhexosaminidase [Hamadaea sp.]